MSQNKTPPRPRPPSRARLAFTLPEGNSLAPGFYRVRDAIHGTMVVDRLFPGDEVIGVGGLGPVTADERRRGDAVLKQAMAEQADAELDAVIESLRHLHNRHDDVDGRRVFVAVLCFSIGFACGALVTWHAPAIARWLLVVGP